ncbi:unnamed protein product, partial [Mesorhabditis belari]|uniref:Uncharacterized protein n=1 Tax=Mesorhabditis belari TaxID=2138241 RepID=A0AAF3F2F9_9BILA
MVSSLLILSIFTTAIIPVKCVICWQCGGEEYGSGLRVLHSSCCRPQRRVCGDGLACLRATVNSPGMQFILSGCHPPEDGFIGCDLHHLPFNATIQRCACLDEACQEYFPGNCPSTSSPPLVAPVPANVFTNLINNVDESAEKSAEKSGEYGGDDDDAFRAIRERHEPVKILKISAEDSGEVDPLIDPKISILPQKRENSSVVPSRSAIFLIIFYFLSKIL